MKNKRAKVFVVFLGAALLLSPLVMLISCKQLHKTPATPPPPPDLTNPTPVTKYKVTITQPANGNIEVSPALPADGMVNTGSELTFTLSAHKGYNVKTLTIGGTAYSVVSNKRITTKVKITKETSISAIIEAETKPAPKPDNPPPENPEQGNSDPPNPNPNPQPNPNPNPTPNPNPSNPTPNTKYKVTVTQPANGTIEVVPALPADGMVDKGSELTFTLSANAGYKVKALTIGDATYSDVTDNTITQKVKIEKETAVSAVLEEEASPTPETGIFTDTQGNKVTIEPVEDYYGEVTGYRLTGDIYIEDINSAAFKAKLDTLNGKELYTDSLNINCFTNQNSTITPKEITPEVLTGVLTIGEERKFSAFRLNNKTADNSPIDIPFKSDTTNYFDITNLAQFSFNENFKLTNDSKILLRAEREPDLHGTEDHTKYAKTTELLSLVNNPKIKHKITVGKVQLRGNVKDLLPLLVGSNKIKEEDGGIIFGKAYDTPCTGENWTGYNGIINDNGNINNTERGVLPADQFLELKKRSGDKQSYIRNAIITGLDSKNMTPEQLENAQFYHDILTNVNFKNSDLSKIQMEAIFAGTGKLEFENTILPPAILNSSIGTLILKNATLPEELKTASLRSMINRVPTITNSLKIYNLKNKFFDKWKEEDMQQLTPYKTAPEKYTGPKDVWDKLKFLYRETEQTETQFTDADLTGSIQKQQNQLLALLQTQNKSRG